MTKTVSAYKMRRNLGEILNEVYYSGNEYIVERAGKPMIKLVSLSSRKDDSLENLAKMAGQALKKEKITFPELLNNLERNREEFYRAYLRKSGGKI